MRLCIHSITLQLLSPHGSWYIFSWTFSYGLLALWLLELDSCMTVEVRGWWEYFTISAEKLWSRANHLDPTGNGPSVRPQQADGLLQFESSPNSTAYASLKINIPLADIAQYLFQQNSLPFCLLTSSFHTISLKKSLFFFLISERLSKYFTFLPIRILQKGKQKTWADVLQLCSGKSAGTSNLNQAS